MQIAHPQKSQGKKIVTIVGAGFAGLNAAKSFAGLDEFYVILIDQKNHHLFQPLLYQVATAGLNPSDIAVPIRNQFTNDENIEVHMGTVDHVDLGKKTIKAYSSTEEFESDYLILACGAQHSYFNHPEWEEAAPGLKTVEQATEIRRRILSAFENAENEFDPKLQEALLTFVVVGGGPTGVELAGAISDICNSVLVDDFKRIDPSQARILLVEAGPKILSAFNEGLSQYAAGALRKMNVDVRTNSRVDNITRDGVQIGAQWIPAKTVLWAAGVQGNKIKILPEVKKDRFGKILVQKDLSIPGHPEVFVIGDLAAVETSAGNFVPGLAPAAIQEGQHVAKVIRAAVRNQPRENFQYWDKGQMATIGKNKAVMQAGKLALTGRLAWLGWLFVHIFFLVGFKNRVSVLLLWAWSYLFSKRGARLITDSQWELPKDSLMSPVRKNGF